jgi:hypothetical protein
MNDLLHLPLPRDLAQRKVKSEYSSIRLSPQSALVCAGFAAHRVLKRLLQVEPQQNPVPSWNSYRTRPACVLAKP